MKRSIVCACLVFLVSLGSIDAQRIKGVEDLAWKADLVAEAQIQSISELVTAPNGVTASVDILLRINNVFKGSREVRQAVVTLRRGPFFNAELKAGQRYVVFLIQSETDARRPVPDGLDRYETLNEYIGPFRMDGDKVRVVFGDEENVFRAYDGADVSRVLAEVRGAALAASQRPPFARTTNCNAGQQSATGGTIAGHVAEQGTGRRLKKAIVTLRRSTASGKCLSAVQTGYDGTYTFNNVAPGEYTVTAQLDQYVPWEFGQRARGEKGTPITVKAGERLDSLNFEMIKAGVIP
jgi:hypothetical protein